MEQYKLPEMEPPEGFLGDNIEMWMAYHGIYPRVPTIRSSDLDLHDNAPFTYLLTRRWGFHHPIAPEDSSKALSLGIYFHKAGEGLLADRKTRFTLATDHASQINAHRQELAEAVDQRVPEQMPDQEREMAGEAATWFDAANHYRPLDSPDLSLGFHHFLKQRRMIATELYLAVRDADFPQTKLACRLDALTFDPHTNSLDIIDYKTCSGPTEDRLQSCPIEFSTRHYCYITSIALPSIIERYDLPGDTRLRHMIHIAVRKPSISFGNNDRDYHYNAVGARSKVSGQARLSDGFWRCTTLTESNVQRDARFRDENAAYEWLWETCGKKPDKIYASEPSWDNYYERCKQWYHNTEHAVNISRTPLNVVLDKAGKREYLEHQLPRIYRAATVPPVPGNFERKKADVNRINGKLKDLAWFALNPPADWPSILLSQGFTQHFREDEEEEQTE